ncbi:predicted protein [Pyrenophora tritici-repentis Pt-1C-BFP]|uniref:Uncharacterized protein n=1 Tax=Pyrenophora tritici-repentis (strain Pt-1C-BFP) TaxID=426418 RepID=B2W8E5_PYRTR|nr:uncharacterized protein PTRG_06253 [Pyrenophora tritici-repentis Pt-1C-BFP]EDU49173.1 predicted protein [Pyrenophora tritici-repentis Pt-1C-BFP]
MQVHEIHGPWAQRRCACSLGVLPVRAIIRSVGFLALLHAPKSTQDTNAAPHGARPPFAMA